MNSNELKQKIDKKCKAESLPVIIQTPEGKKYEIDFCGKRNLNTGHKFLECFWIVLKNKTGREENSQT